jgi:hypothetical protein
MDRVMELPQIDKKWDSAEVEAEMLKGLERA